MGELMIRTGRRSLMVPLVATVLALSMLATACGGSSKQASNTATKTPTKTATFTTNFATDEGTPKNGGTLAWGLEAESDSLSPVTGRWALSGHMVGSAIFDPLATLDANGNPEPFLAKSWSHSADYRTWTIELRQGVKFTDGEDFNAQVAALNLNTDKAALIEGKAWIGVTSITATGPYTITIQSGQPWATFPDVLLGQTGYMVAPATLADPYGGDHPIGTGPFMLKEWDKNEQTIVVKNPHYWRAGLPHLDEIIFKIIPDAATRLKAVQDGTVDAVDMVTAQQVAAIREDSSLHRLEYNRGEELMVPLNTQQPPFNNIHARLALAYATNQSDFLKKLGQNIYTPANGMFAPGQLGYTANSDYPTYDLTKAKAEVAEYTKETGQPLSFTLNAVSEVAYASQDQLLEQMWEAAGAHVSLTSQDQADQVVNVVLGKYQAADFRLFGSPDPDEDYYFWTQTSVGASNDISLNFPRYATTATQDALLAGRATTDPTKRNAAYQQFERLTNQAVPYIWLARTDWTIASSTKVHGYVAAGNGSISTLGNKTWLGDLWLSN
jgi:peptide/nickel transport system substrate-binding protein